MSLKLEVITTPGGEKIPMMTRAQVAQRIQKGVSTIRRMTRQGAIPPPIRIGQELRWEAKAIEDWIAAGCPKQAPSRKARSKR